MRTNLILLTLLVCISACDGPTTNDSISPSEKEVSLNYYFENELFVVRGYETKEGFKPILNEEYYVIKEIHEKHEDLATFIDNENPNNIYLSKNPSTSEKFRKEYFKNRERKQRISSTDRLSYTFWTGTHYGGTKMLEYHGYVQGSLRYVHVPETRPPHTLIVANDALSSFNIISGEPGQGNLIMVRLYEHEFYGGKTLYLSSYDRLDVESLSNYRFNLFHTWNDEVTSLQFDY